MGNEVYLTRAGFHKLQTQLESLKTTERQKIAKAIGEARAQGDISENAEYDAAKDAHAPIKSLYRTLILIPDHAHVGQLSSKFRNTRLIMGLGLFGRVIFCVLGN